MVTESGFKDCSQNSDFNLADSPKKKPCEICGSFENELLIMSCFNCSETREHIYCAKVMLRRVPSMWLCEECRNSSSLVEIADKTANSQVEEAIDQTTPSSRTIQAFHNRDDFIHQTDPSSTDQVMNNIDSIEASQSSITNQVLDNKEPTEAYLSTRTKQVEYVVVSEVVPHVHQYTTSEESSLEPSYPVSPCSSLAASSVQGHLGKASTQATNTTH